jgi:hypothetical protein
MRLLQAERAAGTPRAVSLLSKTSSVVTHSHLELVEFPARQGLSSSSRYPEPPPREGCLYRSASPTMRSLHARPRRRPLCGAASQPKG